MSLQHLSIDAVSESNLSRLVTDGVCESKILEYKEALVVTTDDQKQEFLSDVTALANTNGGDLILGMKENDGVAVELVGLKNLIPDEAIGRIENLLRDSIQPRLAGVQLKALPLANGNYVLLVRTPRSFSAPHMVRHHGVTRFCGRNTNGKYDLDVHELRSAFLASESMSDRLKNFRIERINKLVSGTLPLSLTSSHLIVLHVLPVLSTRPDAKLVTADFLKLTGNFLPRPIKSRSWRPSYNLDGVLISSSLASGSHHAFVQIFRNGFMESVESQLLNPSGPLRQSDERNIPSNDWEQNIIEAFSTYLAAFTALEIPPPYVASISLLNVRGFSMCVGPQMYPNDGRPVDRDHLLTDEILIEATSEQPAKVLRPLFDQVWNACGWLGSINYDDQGNWRAHR